MINAPNKDEECFKWALIGVLHHEEIKNNLERISRHRLNRLNMKGISDQDYEHAQQVWNTMERKTLGCYHDTFLATDVLLLADVFETFHNACLKKFKLDPAHFYTAPGLA